MRNLLVALKDRGEAVRLAAASAALAGPGARATAVHVVEVGSRREFAEAGIAVAETVDLLGARGVTAGGLMEALGEGGVAGRLAQRARTSGADGVVMGSRGLGDFRALVAGSVSHALLAGVDLPVRAAVRDNDLRRVLVAVGTEDDAGAAAAAVRLLRSPSTEVLAVHVPRRVAVHA